MVSFAVSEQNSLIATDVKVAPGGTENVDTEIYEAVVSQPLTEPQVSSDLKLLRCCYPLFLVFNPEFCPHLAR